MITIFPEVIQIWDTFLADGNRFEFVIYVCCAMILSVKHLYTITHVCIQSYSSCIKDELLKGDFGENILLLQVCMCYYYLYNWVCLCVRIVELFT